MSSQRHILFCGSSLGYDLIPLAPRGLPESKSEVFIDTIKIYIKQCSYNLPTAQIIK